MGEKVDSFYTERAKLILEYDDLTCDLYKLLEHPG